MTETLRMKHTLKTGFTLAELLIVLAILGVIATFTIPKILSSQTNSKANAIAKEAAGMVSQAYQILKLNNGVTAATNFGELTPYMNYVSVNTDGSTLIDDHPPGASRTCIASFQCYLMHNGAVVRMSPPMTMGGTANTNAFYFYVDPDGVYGGQTDGPSKSTLFVLYYNNRLRTYGSVLPNTVTYSFTFTGPDPTRDPEYFSWSE